MNAYLMSAGMAVRLRPLTEKFPKCLLRVGGVEMLDLWITACLRANIFDAIYINVHHCPERVRAWLEKYKNTASKSYPSAEKSIRIIDETSGLLGTAGTLYWHGDHQRDFFMAYTDTYSRKIFESLREMAWDWHDNPDNPLAGLVTFNLPADGSAGAIETDFMGTVKRFTEKADSGLIGWAGMMFARGAFIDEILPKDRDLARDVFPRLCDRMRVIAHIAAYDIGRGVEEYQYIKSGLDNA